MTGLGDKVAKVATPIARALKLPCVDPVTKELKPDSRCNKRIRMLNEGRYADAFYDIFWNKTTEEKMQFTIQVAVEAEDVKDAIEKLSTGTVIAVTPRQSGQVQLGPAMPSALELQKARREGQPT